MAITKYSFGLEGELNFMKAAMEAQGESIEPFYESSDWAYSKEYFSQMPALDRKKELTAFGGTEAVGIVIVFLGTCFAKKIFDEFYDRTLKRPIGKYIDSILEKIQIPKNKHLEYRDVIYLEDIDLTIVIRLVVDSKTTGNIDRQLSEAHRLAFNYIEKNGRKAPIHCHRIVLGEIDPEPELYTSLEHIKQTDRTRFIVRF